MIPLPLCNVQKFCSFRKQLSVRLQLDPSSHSTFTFAADTPRGIITVCHNPKQTQPLSTRHEDRIYPRDVENFSPEPQPCSHLDETVRKAHSGEVVSEEVETGREGGRPLMLRRPPRLTTPSHLSPPATPIHHHHAPAPDITAPSSNVRRPVCAPVVLAARPSPLLPPGNRSEDGAQLHGAPKRDGGGRVGGGGGGGGGARNGRGDSCYVSKQRSTASQVLKEKFARHRSAVLALPGAMSAEAEKTVAALRRARMGECQVAQVMERHKGRLGWVDVREVYLEMQRRHDWQGTLEVGLGAWGGWGGWGGWGCVPLLQRGCHRHLNPNQERQKLETITALFL